MEETTTQFLTGNGELMALPLVTQSPESHSQIENPYTNAVPPAVPRILLVEDNADARVYLQRLLEPHYEVTAVADGQAALDAFYQQPPDLVLSDMAMPRLDGMQLLRLLKAQHHTARVPVMLMSGEAGEGIRIEAYQTGAVDYLLKPFSARELLVRVQAQLQLAPIQPGNERQLISLLAQTPVAIAVLRGPRFVVELATPAMCEFWNRSLSQLLGQPLFEVLTEAAGQGFEELMTGVLQTGIPFEGRELPVTLIRDGKPQPVLVNVLYQPLRDQPDGPVSGIVIVATDVTELVRVRRVVEDSAHRLQALFEQAPVGVAIVGLGPDIRFELANPLYCELVGRRADQLIGKPLWEALPEVAGQDFYKLLMRVMATGTPYSSRETPINLIRNGQLETLYVDFVYQPRREPDQRITGVVCIVTDVTMAVRARHRVEANERMLDAMVKQTPLAVGIFRGSNHIIELANPILCQLWDRTPGQLVSQPLFTALPEAAGQGSEKMLANVYKTGIPFEGYQQPAILKRNGRLETRYFDFVYKPLRNQDGSIERVMVVATDVTQARQAQLVIEETNVRLQTVFAQAPVAVAIIGTGPDFTIELANPFYCEIVGRTANQLIGKPLLASMPELGGQGFEALLTQVMATGEPYISREMPIDLVRNGELKTVYVDFVYQPRYEADRFRFGMPVVPVPLRETGTTGAVPDGASRITGVVCIVTDVTMAVRARHRVEANERMLDAMVKQTPLGVAIFRGPDHIIELVNPTLCQLWKCTPEQMREKPFFEALPEFAGQGFEELLAGVYETGIPFEVKEMPITIERNGLLKTIYFDFAHEPLRNQEGNIERIMVVATDATGAREARLVVEESEQHHRQLAAELAERVKHRTLELERSNLDLMQFASVASHDLKEPLRKVQIFGTRLEGLLAGRLNEEETDLFRRLVGATARMQTLVGDVLRLSILSDQTAGFEPVVLNTTIDRIRDDLEVVIYERGAEVTTEPLPTVLAAEGQMHQLFQNLISNALKFNTNPVPTVRVELVPLTDTVADELGLPTLDYAVIAVTDNGIGFESKYNDKIFDMFQRLNGRSQYAGTGIGLTIVRRIVENHRGFIDVRSELGRGTKFRVALPFR